MEYLFFSRSRSRSRSNERSSSRRDKSDKSEKSEKRDKKRRARSSDRSRRDEREKSTHREKVHRESSSEIETLDLTNCVDKEEEKKQLEQEMNRRRDRVERWRAERKRKDLENKKVIVLPTPTAKKWSLENESDDDDDVKEVPLNVKESPPSNSLAVDSSNIEPQSDGNNQTEPENDDKMDVQEEEEDDIDPLDAYMMEVNKEVRKVNKLTKPPSKTTSGIVVMTGVAKKNVELNKGEMMEQNQDGLEYSSEEEVEDIKDTAANLANKHKKELAKIDHSGVSYMPFRKSFYVEVPELAKMTPIDVDAYKVELEGIQVKGKGCPKPIKTWAHCGISKKEMDVLKRLGFEKPTPIQCQAIPAIMSGRDLIGIAKTGSGKTIAFILPMFRHILDQQPLEDGDGPVSIIMTPTRELCMQIGKDIRKFAKSLNLRAVCVYGGTGISEQIAELKRGAEIIVCTPGTYFNFAHIEICNRAFHSHNIQFRMFQVV